MKKFKSLCFAMVFFMALAMLLPTSAYAAKSAGTIKNNVQVLMEYADKSTVPIPEAKVGVKGGLLGTKFLLGSEYHECNDDGKVNFRQTSRITDMYFELPEAWADKVETEEARAEYRAKLIGNFRYHNYKANITNNKFRVGMPLAWTTVDTTIYLKAKSFNVVFEPDNGSDKIVKEVEYLKQVEKPNAPEKEGHTFEGWYKDGKEFNFETQITEDITLRAKWKINKYTVTFDSNGGTEVEPKTVEYGNTVEAPLTKKEGHTFEGWYKDGEEFKFDTPIKENITLTAKWEINEYNVIFNSNGGTEVAAKKVKFGEKIEEPTTEREGYTLEGWFNDNIKVEFPLIIKDNIVLTAKWKINEYTLTFQYADGDYDRFTGFVHGKKFSEHPDFPLSIKTPSKDGFIFKGWLDENEVQFTVDAVITGDMVLHPKWILNTTFDSRPVRFYVYNKIRKGEMSWLSRDFVKIEEKWGYISNFKQLEQLEWTSQGVWPFMQYALKADKIPDSSKLYDADGEELDVRELINEDWVSNNMNEDVKNKLAGRNYELQVYRLIRTNNEPIHVDLAFYDKDANEWVHNID